MSLSPTPASETSVLKTAREIAEDYNGILLDGDIENLTRAIEEAIMAEREACAKIAEAMVGTSYADLGSGIAAKIRAR